MKYKFRHGNAVAFRPTDSDRAGQVIPAKITRRLTRKEADAEVGPMYLLSTGDNAFEDELQGVVGPWLG